MEGFFRRYRNELALILVLLAQTIGLAVQVSRANYGARSDGHHVRLFRLGMDSLLAPPEKLLARTGHFIRGLWFGYIDLRHVRDENRVLNARLSELRLYNAALAEDAQQGRRLRAILGFKQQYVAHTVAAQVIGNSGSDNSHIVLLDKGSEDGLQPDMPVITPDGVAGKLRNVFPHSSELLLLNDASAGAGVVLQKTRIRAILHGTPDGIAEITNLLPDTRIQAGDTILTSGGDRVFPRGLNIGRVKSVGLDRDHQPYAQIIVEPAVKLERLEEVLIITDITTDAPALPPGTPEAAADPAATSTSQIVAERLPGLHDPGETPAAVTPNGAPAAAPIPKPGTPLHADRYSPGSAPPANSLTPGARNAAQEGSH